MLFTPYINERSQRRAELQISTVDYGAFQNLPKGRSGPTVEVFDQTSEKWFTVARASCGSACFCAAVVTKISTVKIFKD